MLLDEIHPCHKTENTHVCLSNVTITPSPTVMSSEVVFAHVPLSAITSNYAISNFRLSTLTDGVIWLNLVYISGLEYASEEKLFSDYIKGNHREKNRAFCKLQLI